MYCLCRHWEDLPQFESPQKGESESESETQREREDNNKKKHREREGEKKKRSGGRGRREGSDQIGSDMDERMPGVGLKGVGGKCGGGRWNPTAEQVKVLTDLFRSGLRTPTTDQIQNISSHLSFYGQIESKNVFYWFQNHKARERQKRRRISHSVHHVDRDHHLALVKHGGEADLQVMEQERAIETLQLFPLNTYEEESQVDKFRYRRGEWKEITFLPATGEDPPPLDLRLSSL